MHVVGNLWSAKTTLRSLRDWGKWSCVRIGVLSSLGCSLWTACGAAHEDERVSAPSTQHQLGAARDPYALSVPPSPRVSAEPVRTLPDAAPVTLSAITVYGNGSEAGAKAAQVRVVLTFDAMAVFHRGESEATPELPRRVFLDLDSVTLGPASVANVSVGAGGLTRVRTFALDDDKTRVSFDVAADTVYRVFYLTRPYRVILDFHRTEARAAGNGLRTIVLDPGHGGAQDGARGPNGIEESVVALALALRVKKTLSRTLPGTRVVLTRDSDRTVTLEERSALANALDAELFVSIHLNASPSPADRGGVATYVLDITDDAQALRLAARENDAEVKDITDLQKLFASLYRKDQVAHSLDLAEAIQGATLKRGRERLPSLEDRGVKKALFYVLVGTTMPAVLCEASFITRPEEAAALATDAYRDALAAGIAEGIANYAAKAARRRAEAKR
jgi:N-acetylmuramoyl-L-alanine amidase